MIYIVSKNCIYNEVRPLDLQIQEGRIGQEGAVQLLGQYTAQSKTLDQDPCGYDILRVLPNVNIVGKNSSGLSCFLITVIFL